MGNKSGKNAIDQRDQTSQITSTPDNDTSKTNSVSETMNSETKSSDKALDSSQVIYADPIVRVPNMPKENMSVERLSELCFSTTDVLPDHAISRINSDDGETTGQPPPNSQDQPNHYSSIDKPSILQMCTSRTGRQNQRYVKSPTTNLPTIRLSVGSVPILRSGKILMVSSTRKETWILPKGGWELDEVCEDGVLRETYEEGGILGTLGAQLKDVEYDRVSKASNSTQVRMLMYLLYVMEVREDWPEKWRARKAVDIDTAIEMVTGRPEFQKVLMEVKEKGYHLVPSSLDEDGDVKLR